MIWVFLSVFLVFSPSLAMYVMNYDYCNGAKYSPAPARSLFSKHKLTASCKLQLSVSICEDKPLHYPGSLSCRLHTVSSVLLSPPFAFSIPFLWGRVSVVYKHILEQIAWSVHQNDASTRGSYPSKTILWETDSGLTFPDLRCPEKGTGGCHADNQPFFRTEWPLQRVPREWAQGQEPVSELGNVRVEKAVAKGPSQRKDMVRGAQWGHSAGP